MIYPQISHHINFLKFQNYFLKKKPLFFENVNISKYNIINVELAQVIIHYNILLHILSLVVTLLVVG
jgi:hypothetical protein